MRRLLILLAALPAAACTSEVNSSDFNTLKAPNPDITRPDRFDFRPPVRTLLPGARCTGDAQPLLTSVRAQQTEEEAHIEVQIDGLRCGAEVLGFHFRLLNHEGVDITGRSWPEVDTVTVVGDRFTLRGAAAGCGDYRDGRVLVVEVGGSEATVEISGAE